MNIANLFGSSKELKFVIPNVFLIDSTFINFFLENNYKINCKINSLQF